jgi:uncharacterized protein YhfF
MAEAHRRPATVTRFCFVAAPAATPGLLLDLADGPEQKARCRSCRWMTWPVVRGRRSERRAPLVDPRVVDFSLGMEQRICEFGFPGPLRDRLVDAVLSGVKTATSSLLADWQRDGEQPPAAGELQTVIDSAGIPVAIIEILGSEVVALGAVDDRVARAEGESYQTAAGWRSAHERFWREEVFPDWEGEVPVLDDSTPVVVEWFRLQERV